MRTTIGGVTHNGLVAEALPLDTALACVAGDDLACMQIEYFEAAMSISRLPPLKE